MKKIICLLLTVFILVATLASCSFKKDSIDEVVAGSEPTKIVTEIQYVGKNDTLTTFVSTSIDRTNQRALTEYTRDRHATPADNSEDRIITDRGTIYYDMQTGRMKDLSDSSGGWQNYSGSFEAKLNLSSDSCKSYEVSKDGNSVTATFLPEKAMEILGYEIQTLDNSEITIKRVTDGEYLNLVEISYTLPSGASAVIRTSYTYDKRITVDAVE